ncbi:histidine kinase [uncultured Proteiniphilum sp.]|uniref:sensor histidine kinase n=1 Tax=uncultured Proteiniphilum sp. TaxID=497637 RepID=UPI002637149F|nr:histidine kinase [uncultured Proteiniphilum sp.]
MEPKKTDTPDSTPKLTIAPDKGRYRLSYTKIADNIFIHIAAWCIIFGLPLFFMSQGNFSWISFLLFIPVPVCFMIVFYSNYFYFVDHFLFQNKKNEFLIINIALILGTALLIHLWHEFSFAFNIPGDKPPFGGANTPAGPPGPEKSRIVPVMFFILRDVVSLILVVILSTAIKMSRRWTKIEVAQKEMQQAMIEAELKNLKNQINPHFLLNTLNNIYALAQLNSPKVKPAIMDLSRLLQYVLYENNKMYVPLKEEVNFIRNYIDLMRLRLPDNTDLSVKFDLRENSEVMIAPLIFISLIENAFKHGISSGEYSFIDISLVEKEDGRIEFLCGNSYFPKDESDKSGSGIGLQQVQKRLELLYPYRYMWHTEIEDDIYSTVLIIETKRT